MDSHGNTQWLKKPNRRLRNQRRVNRLDRRQSDMLVTNCRRSTSLSRRCDERRMHASEWIQMSNIKTRKQNYICANDAPRMGLFVDLAV